jgi:hypothetical protein
LRLRPSENRVRLYGAKQATVGPTKSVRFGLKRETIPYVHRAVLGQRGSERGHIGRNRVLAHGVAWGQIGRYYSYL